MTNSIFHINEFKINGISVPEFDLNKGKLIRIYVPFIGENNSVLGHNLTKELIKQFQSQKSNFPFAENYQKKIISEIISPLTVDKYLKNEMWIDKHVGKRIVDEIGINLSDKVEHLSLTNKKALIIKCLFEKNDFIILDYYGVDSNGIGILEKLVNSEIEKGKSGIALDRLEFVTEKEPFENITPIKLTVPNNVYN
ncbi:hypothetical protein [Psychroserpens ponticola]|uniref:DUF1444 family protein n=1 Tax=Psychroserpens ponticola TaxID=2932268 RepID=A0ABY7S3N3_9FLAO|nr:hypothetical protein [Psychroserpens ponticola]WCO03587.1 hypothetical protein MUN68_008770 [Psychroserpens ponticola]